MAKITKQNGQLVVPDVATVPFIEGDGVGAEITPICRQVVDAAVRKAYNGQKQIEWKEVFAGGKANEQVGEWLPQATLDMCIFRENTEDIYAGIEWEEGSDEARKFFRFLHDDMGVNKVRFPDTSGFGVKPVSREGSERLIRSAIEYALTRNLPSVTLVHKGNIMKFTEGGFKKWGYELAEREYGEALKSGRLIVNDCICDAFLQNVLIKPQDYSVIATMNLNGDYISDMLAAQVGGIGIAPGANINYVSGHAIFEATHGIAPDIAGKDKVNPSSIILSAVMMLDYIGWKEAGRLITDAMERLFVQGCATADLARFMDHGKSVGSREFGEKLIETL